MPLYELLTLTDQKSKGQKKYIIEAKSKLALLEYLLSHSNENNIYGEILIWLAGEEHQGTRHIVLRLKSLCSSTENYTIGSGFVIHDRSAALNKIKQTYTSAQHLLQDIESRPRDADGNVIFIDYRVIDEIAKDNYTILKIG